MIPTALTRATKPFSIKWPSRNSRAVSVSASCLSLFAVAHCGCMTGKRCGSGLWSDDEQTRRDLLGQKTLSVEAPSWFADSTLRTI